MSRDILQEDMHMTPTTIHLYRWVFILGCFVLAADASVDLPVRSFIRPLVDAPDLGGLLASYLELTA